MNAEYKKLMQSLINKQYATFYLIDGEEPYYLEQITQYFENNILQPAEKDFNLITLYGKDTDWAEVVNACRRFPMFAERQVVILKDAAQMRSLSELSGYLENPAPTTVFLIEHRFKKTDGRSVLVKLAKNKGFYFNSEKLKEEQLPGWIQNYGLEIGFHIGEREAQILATYLGNDLQKIENEIAKIRINVPEQKALTADLIQKYIGISKEYNVFELPEILTSGDKDKLYRMLHYFTANPKSAPMPLVIGMMYTHFQKLYAAHFHRGKSDKDLSQTLNVWGERLRQLKQSLHVWDLFKVESALLLLGKYSAFSVGVDNNTADKELLKELIGKLEILGAIR